MWKIIAAGAFAALYSINAFAMPFFHGLLSKNNILNPKIIRELGADASKYNFKFKNDSALSYLKLGHAITMKRLDIGGHAGTDEEVFIPLRFQDDPKIQFQPVND